MAPDIIAFFERYLGRVSDADRERLAREIAAGSKPSNEYFTMLILAAVIATVGLITDSAAAIIGAMLVSPLLIPVIGSSLGAVKGDLRLFWRAVEAEAKGAAVVLVLAIFITLLIPNAAAGSEIMLRTRPTPLDLLIALASGAAGAYALSKKSIGATLPGVAIAVAMLPPLCVAGIGFALRSPEIALGGFLTFIANVVAINFAASVVFWLVGFRHKWSMSAEKDVMKKLQTSAVLLLVISIPLAYIMWQSLEAADVKNTVEQTLLSQLEGIPFARLDGFDVSGAKAGGMRIAASIDSPKEITQDKAGEIRAALEKRLGADVELVLTVNKVDLIASGSKG